MTIRLFDLLRDSFILRGISGSGGIHVHPKIINPPTVVTTFHPIMFVTQWPILDDDAL
jgi:hypothetical protein